MSEAPIADPPSAADALAYAFARAGQNDRAALGGYFTLGFPTLARSQAVFDALAPHCDFLEIGLPHDEPVLDGKPITEASKLALSNGVTVADVFPMVRKVATTVPVVVMSYWAPIRRYGAARFAAEFAEAGGAGVILPDLPAHEAGFWLATAAAHDLVTVPVLLDPAAEDSALAETCAAAGGFVYAAATLGPTGGQGPLNAELPEFVTRIRAHTTLPVCAGIGVAGISQAAVAATLADGVIVGSAFVRRLLADPTREGVRAAGEFAETLARAMYR